MKKIKIFTFLFLSSFSILTQAQQAFTEGTVTYAISIGPVLGQTGFTEHAGTFTITIKGQQIKKALKMNSGYENTMLINTNSGIVYSLQNVQDQKLAIQLTMEDLIERQKPYENYTVSKLKGTSTIAGELCDQSTITYKDGKSCEIYCAQKWTTSDAHLFDRLPSISAFPLAFEYRNEEGIVMHFNAEKMDASPVENALFKLPINYKIISNKEYKILKKGK